MKILSGNPWQENIFWKEKVGDVLAAVLKDNSVPHLRLSGSQKHDPPTSTEENKSHLSRTYPNFLAFCIYSVLLMKTIYLN